MQAAPPCRRRGDRANAGNHGRDGAARCASLVEVAVDRRRRGETDGIGPARRLEQLPSDRAGDGSRYTSTASMLPPRASASPAPQFIPRAPAALGRKTPRLRAAGDGNGARQAFGRVNWTGPGQPRQHGRPSSRASAVAGLSRSCLDPHRASDGVEHQFEDTLHSVRGREPAAPGKNSAVQLRLLRRSGHRPRPSGGEEIVGTSRARAPTSRRSRASWGAACAERVTTTVLPDSGRLSYQPGSSRAASPCHDL